MTPTTTPPGDFRVDGPLPTGTTVLEASAGTGKTWTLAALATRYVAEGHAELSQLMLVTFGRAATQELRERVRERLRDTERALRPGAGASDDPVVRLLADAPAEVVAQRRARLATALSSFDAATIATTHAAYQQVLRGLGVVGDVELGATFVETVGDLLAEVVDDLYVGKYARPGAPPPGLTHDEAVTVARSAVLDPQAELVDGDGERHGLARAARTHVERRKRARRLLDFDDLVTRLRDALADPDTGPVACVRLRDRYRVVLVDEFQDTDPVQWDVLRRAFHGHLTLVLIGDPKQAVYAFRGGDVTTYLAAAGEATALETLGCSFRSDEHLLAALDLVHGGAALGDPRIVVRPVSSAHPGSRLSPGTPALRLRRLRRDRAGPLGRGDLPAVARVRTRIAQDLADDVVALLSGATLLSGRSVRPGDVAVLVRTNAQGATVRDALAAVGVQAVLAGSASVFDTDGARDWLVLLQALEQPHRAARVRAAALTPFAGWTAERLDAAGDGALDELGPLLRTWGAVLAQRGVAALAEVMGADLPERLLAQVDGERRLTDLRHLAEALHTASVQESLGLTALLEWLQRRRAESTVEGVAERSRRLESDAEAVQVVTVHRSKGLEFPVVYVPFGWDRWRPTSPDPLRLHDPHGTRLLDVGGPSAEGYAERRGVHEQEEAGEELRLLYVALTRAESQVVTWWAPSSNTPTSALHRLLLGERADDGTPQAVVRVPTDEQAAARLQALADRSGGSLRVEEVGPTTGLRWDRAAVPAADLEVAAFDRALDTAWRRTSYTGLTAGAHEAAHRAAGTSEPEEPEQGDEAPLDTGTGPAPGAAVPDPDEARLRAVPSPMDDLPAGAVFGTLVHLVLEQVDTSAPDLAAEVLARCREACAARLSDVDPAALATALVTAMSTPLGPLASGRALRDVAPRDALVELGFELPLAGGDDRRGPGTTPARLADVLRRHLPADDPLAAYPDALAALAPQSLRGYLTGSIDAVLRVGDRHLVVDHKTNRLAAGPLTAWHYRPAALAPAMVEAHYPLQALLYSVALHRFLRGRLPSYDPGTHLGGVLYLFVRGMTGPDAPTVDGVPCGVFSWRPDAALVTELSDLLA